MNIPTSAAPAHPLLDLGQYLIKQEDIFRALMPPGMTLRYSLPSSLPRVTLDPHFANQLFESIICSARKAVPSGGQISIQCAHVSLSDLPHEAARSGLASKNGYVMVAFSYSGKAVSPNDLLEIKRIFSNTERRAMENLQAPTYIGQLIKGTDGRLLFVNHSGKGDTLKVYFPTDVGEKNAGNGLIGLTKGSETLLFVEDDLVVRRIYTRFLRQRGYNVLEAQHGKEAFRVYETHQGPIHLMVTDVVMPELNGRQLVELVSMRHPHLKVLYISGFTKNAIIERGILKESMPFLEKPFGREELAMKIRQILDVRA